MNKIKLSLFILFSMSWLVASTIRIMTYNLLNFGDENDREDDCLHSSDVLLNEWLVNLDCYVVKEFVGRLIH